ncbi:Endonuclease/exonuclease/phosphatase [Chaetomium fimeti]|uniref:Endonuclease/exonuclease/phosphatase n=1 Tax=Chaetomium fimeti TaxID=1854472 RepID=A0AAE0HIX7_9PEZI|nr:Endonuclease/exonuclease/phosphatase [Chaetomium fimeti]
MTPSNFASLSIRLVTLNIRYDTKNPGPGEEPWSVRCPRLCAQLRFITSSQDSPFVCLQEVLHSQLTDVQTYLGPSWGRIGQGRKDGKEAGEYSPIFFRADHWECERSRTFWLSPTPEVPSKGWDAALERVVTMGTFSHRRTGAVVTVMNTHFDHKGEVAREESARLLLKLASTWPGERAPRLSTPVFLGGDFNSTPTGRAYKVLTEPNSGMRDISDILPEVAKYGNKEITFTSFGDDPNEHPARIDFLFVRGMGRLRFLSFGILANKFDDGVYLSDHRPVVADVEVPVQATM